LSLSAQRPANDDNGRFTWAVTLAFVLIAAIGVSFHEPWRDEAQAWLLARDSSSLAALLHNNRYEGGPILWQVLLFPLAHHGGPWLMSVLNLAFATGTIYLFVRFSPFDRVARALFAFGYLPLYEWGTLARSYAAGTFFLFAFAVAFSRRRPILQGLTLAAAANCSVHSAIVSASALVLAIVAGLASQQESAHTHRRWLGGLAFAAAGLVASFLQVLPPVGERLTWIQPASLHRLSSVVCSFPAGFAPFADCWFAAVPLLRSAWLQIPMGAIAVGLTIAFIATAGASLAPRRMAWIVPGLSVLGLGALFFCVWWRGARHAGFLFLATLLGLWLADSLPEREGAGGALARAMGAARRRLPGTMHAVLLFHVVAGATAVVVEVATIFSAARPAAEVIRRQGLGGLPIVADADFTSTGLVAQLGVPSVYYPLVDRWGSFVDWGEHPPDGRLASSDALVFDRAVGLARRSDVVVVVNREPAAELIRRTGANIVAAVAADVVKDESFWIYRIPAQEVAH
jgi:hypothetical protein